MCFFGALFGEPNSVEEAVWFGSNGVSGFGDWEQGGLNRASAGEANCSRFGAERVFNNPGSSEKWKPLGFSIFPYSESQKVGTWI